MGSRGVSMLTIRVDFADSAAPIYRQIADAVRELIAREELSDRDELPSVRMLGQQIGVNQNTVAKAYRILAEEGLVELRHGASVRVSRASARRVEAPTRGDERRLRELISCWVVAGADRRTIERTFARALDEVLGKGRRMGSAS
jgi:GntR family transcriptional regulator